MFWKYKSGPNLGNDAASFQNTSIATGGLDIGEGASPILHLRGSDNFPHGKTPSY